MNSKPFPLGKFPAEDGDRDRVLGFHRIADGPSVRISSGSLLSLPGRVTSAHELEHHRLTETTGFGQLMLLCNFLGYRTVSPGWHEVHLRRLASQCRTTQESWATFYSILMEADGDFALLYGSREYLSWHKVACNAVPLNDRTRLKALALGALADVCMCPPALERFLELGPESIDVWYMPPMDRPDRRFGFINENAPDEFWADLWDGCRALMDAHTWGVFMPSEPSPDMLNESFLKRYDELVSMLYFYLRGRFASLLSLCGARTTFSTEDIIERVVSVVESTAPEARRIIGVTTSTTSGSMQLLSHLFSERILLSDNKRFARLMPLSDFADIPAWVSGDDGQCFAYIIIRSANRLLEQFTFSAGEQRHLERCGNELLTLLVTESSDGRLEMFQVREPSDLRVLEGFGTDLEIHVNWSMKSFGIARRTDEALEGLPLRSAIRAMDIADYRSAVLDFPVAAAVQGWIKDGLQFSYSSAIVRISGQERLHLIVIWLPANSVILVPCGEMQERALTSFLDTALPGVCRDDSLPQADPSRRNFLRAVELLLKTEHVIDFKALTAR